MRAGGCRLSAISCRLIAGSFLSPTRHPERIRGAALEHIPGRKRGEAPAAPGFYRSCADALTDGFRPQSGPVQRGVFYAACGSPPLVAGATIFPRWEACHWIFGSRCSSTNPVPLPPRKSGGLWMLGSGVNLSLWQRWRENHTTGLRPRKCTPFGANAPPFPRRGNFALRSASELISISRYRGAKTSPSGVASKRDL